MLRSKQGKMQNWLPNQVFYGVDTSDSDPAKWQPFGELAERLASEKARQSAKSDPKGSGGLQRAPE